jgi:hypothetical protein
MGPEAEDDGGGREILSREKIPEGLFALESGGERRWFRFPLLCFAVFAWGLSAAWSTVPYFGSCHHLPHGPCNAVPDLFNHSYCHRRHLLPLMATPLPVRAQPHCSVNWRRMWWPTGLGRGVIKGGTWEHRQRTRAVPFLPQEAGLRSQT